MPHNLTTRNGIVEKCDINDLEVWFARELIQVTNPDERTVLKLVAKERDAFVRWATEAILLWPGCDRVPPPGTNQKYFRFPPHLRQLAKAQRIRPDSRKNGPAVVAFCLAGGVRPERFGNSNGWSIHHIYSGKFPYPGSACTTHAVKDGKHFTQSAGLVAIHPIADALVDEFPFFAWLLRAEAFLRFGYDPDCVFSAKRDEYGFAQGRTFRRIECAQAD